MDDTIPLPLRPKSLPRLYNSPATLAQFAPEKSKSSKPARPAKAAGSKRPAKSSGPSSAREAADARSNLLLRLEDLHPEEKFRVMCTRSSNECYVHVVDEQGMVRYTTTRYKNYAGAMRDLDDFVKKEMELKVGIEMVEEMDGDADEDMNDDADGEMDEDMDEEVDEEMDREMGALDQG